MAKRKDRLDVSVPEDPPDLLLPLHVEYLKRWHDAKEDYEYVMSEYLRMSGVYWSLTAMHIMQAADRMDREGILQFVQDCQHDNGGFSAAPGHDPHLLYTLSAIQILVMYDSLTDAHRDSAAGFVAGLQQADGSFQGDQWGEIDTRFSFCAVACLALLGKLDGIRVDDAAAFVLKAQNFDGGFGVIPGSESHAGQVYVCVSTLAITGHLHMIDADQLGWWLSERQLKSGGFNGRPEKLPDVCYSWWVLSSLKTLDRLHWIDADRLTKFILACQDDETGGFSDRPGDMVDPFHTLFGVAAMSLLGDERVGPINSIFCLPQAVVDRVFDEQRAAAALASKAAAE